MPQLRNCPKHIVGGIGRLVHFTHPDNKEFLLLEKTMFPASVLLAREPDKRRWMREKRTKAVALPDGRIIRDQKPFNKGVEWTGGISENKFLNLLNQHVFFWTEADFCKQQRRGGFSGKYQDNIAVVVSFADVIRENPNLPGYFCLCNSGAPRYSNGIKPRRGVETFIPCCGCFGSPGKIREVCLRGIVKIPESAKIIHAFELGAKRRAAL